MSIKQADGKERDSENFFTRRYSLKGEERPAISKSAKTRSSFTKRTDSAGRSSATIPPRKSMTGMSLEGHTLNLEETSGATATYLRQSITPTKVDSEPSYSRPTRSIKSRERSQERQLSTFGKPSPSLPEQSTKQKQNKPKHMQEGMHKVAPYNPSTNSSYEEKTPNEVVVEDLEFGSTTAPARKKKIRLREQKRRHKENYTKFIDDLNINPMERNGEEVSKTDSQIEEEIERLLSRSRKSFGITSISKKQDHEKADDDPFNENRSKKDTKKKVVMFYDEIGKPHSILQENKSAPVEAPTNPENDAFFQIENPIPKSSKANRPKIMRSAIFSREGLKSAWDEDLSSSTPMSPTVANPSTDFSSLRLPENVSKTSKSKNILYKQKNAENDDSHEVRKTNRDVSNQNDSRPWLENTNTSSSLRKSKQKPSVTDLLQRQEEEQTLRNSHANEQSSGSDVDDLFESGNISSRGNLRY